MDALSRGGGLLLSLRYEKLLRRHSAQRALGTAMTLLSCASRPPMDPVGASAGGAAPQRSGGSVAATVSSPLPSDFRKTLAKVNSQRFVVMGHAGGRFDGDLYVTPAAKDTA